ncbi:MAG: hypothetical protein WD187_00540 [Candidatus Woykebacteria bacterium]
MKNLKKFFKQTIVIVSIEIAVAIFLCVIIFLFVVVPNFNSWRSNSSSREETAQRLERVERNLQSVASIDAEKIKVLSEQLQKLLSDQADPLRFLNLLEVVAKSSGMELSAAQVTTQSQPSVAPSAPTGAAAPQTPVSDGASSPAQSGASAVAVPNQSVKISFSGSFSNLLRLLTNVDKADMVSLIKSVSVSKTQGESGVSLAVTFDLITATAAGTANAETLTAFTFEDESAIGNILSNIEFTSSPAKNSVGRSNPFD